MSEGAAKPADGLATIESIDHEGIGVAHVEGKVVFIEGGITGERVAFARRRSREREEMLRTRSATISHEGAKRGSCEFVEEVAAELPLQAIADAPTATSASPPSSRVSAVRPPTDGSELLST